MRVNILVVMAILGGCSSCNDKIRPRSDAKVLPGPDQAPKSDVALVDGKPQPQGWVVMALENFESTSLPAASWSPDSYPDDGPFSDIGFYHLSRGITPPQAHRISAPFGAQGWLTVESYTRDQGRKLDQMVSIVNDPAGGTNKVLRLTSPAHTDATVIRPSQPLPARYRISLRVGYPSFGDGNPSGSNGYDSGDETEEPWGQGDSTLENGFYWLSILDAVPRPHNNLWIHHHRKVVFDSDNHHPPWMEIWDGSSFVSSGVHPIMMFAVDGAGKGDALTGKPFISYSAGQWQPSGEIRAVDAYKPSTWYGVTVERSGDSYTMQVTGDSQFGGKQTYSATIDARQRCVWHYNNDPLQSGDPCVDTGYYPELDSTFPHWPAGQGWPDYFMIGDPHANYYEGFVYYDDIKLEVWQGS